MLSRVVPDKTVLDPLGIVKDISIVSEPSGETSEVLHTGNRCKMRLVTRVSESDDGVGGVVGAVFLPLHVTGLWCSRSRSRT